MFSAKCKVKFKAAEVARMHSQKLRGAMGPQAWLTSRVVKDSDEFVPMYTGMLATSPLRSSNYEKGEIFYNEPYARKMYYGVNLNFSRDEHPLATHHWFEKAKGLFMDYWGRSVAKILRGKWVPKS